MKPLMIFFLFTLGACGQGSSSIEQPTAPIDTRDYFPLSAGNKWVYQYKFKMWNSINKEERHFIVESKEAPDKMPGFVIDEPKKVPLERRQMLYAVREQGIITFAGFHGLNGTAFKPPFVELPLILEPRAKWKWKGQLTESNTVDATFENTFEGLEKIRVPAGEFQCIRIKRVILEAPECFYIHWYAKGVGLVKMESLKPEGKDPAVGQLLELISYQLTPLPQ